MAVDSVLPARTGRKLDASGFTTFTKFYVEADTKPLGRLGGLGGQPVRLSRGIKRRSLVEAGHSRPIS